MYYAVDLNSENTLRGLETHSRMHSVNVAHQLVYMRLQAFLVLAMLCEILMWIDRAEWGILLIAYGMWALHLRATHHLSVFTGTASCAFKFACSLSPPLVF